MTIRKNDRKIRDAAARAARVSPKEVFVELDHGSVIVRLPNSMLMSSDERRRVAREIEVATGGARVALV